MLIGWQGRIFVGLGSDHTDRKVESYSVTVSKQMCDKPISPELWELEDVIGHWDQMILRSWAWFDGQRTLYQEGTLDAMLPVKDLLERGFGKSGLPDGCAMFGGTFAAKGGIRPSVRFEYELEDPVRKRKLTHAYDVIVLPVRGIDGNRVAGTSRVCETFGYESNRPKNRSIRYRYCRPRRHDRLGAGDRRPRRDTAAPC